MAMFGQVFVKKGKYRIKGDFHHLAAHTPIRDADNAFSLCGVTNPRELTYIHSYGGEAVFFESLSRGTLLASRCEHHACECRGTTYLPFRIYCPDCLKRNRVIDVTDEAKRSARIYTFMVCERSGAFSLLEKPIKFINIAFDGIDTVLMSYLSLGEPRIGMEVVPIFKRRDPSYTILDLSWVPKGTPAEELKPGFEF
ncbi:MAG: hypothetical protein JXA30_07880 [Deltaproteobacteria bacterium]|nr:hypothetical protein [Deltaproteobacteria bacterium]